MANVRVRYVGLKDKETDRKAGTGLTWVGKGSVHTVTDKQWSVLSRHPDVWAIAEDGPAAPGLSSASTNTPADPLDGMDDAWLADYAEANGLAFDKRLKGDNRRAAIAAALAAKE